MVFPNPLVNDKMKVGSLRLDGYLQNKVSIEDQDAESGSIVRPPGKRKKERNALSLPGEHASIVSERSFNSMNPPSGHNVDH